MSKLKFVLLPLALTLLLAVDDAQVSSAAPLLATGVPVTVTNTAVPVTGLVRVYGDVAVNRLPVTEHFHRRVPFTAAALALQPLAGHAWAMLSASVAEFTLPTYSSIILPPGTGMRVGAGISSAMRGIQSEEWK